MGSEIEEREMQQRFNREEDGSNEHLELFLHQMAVLVVGEFVGLSTRGDGGEGEVERSIIGWLQLMRRWPLY